MTTKTCKQCNVEKGVSAYHKQKSGKFGVKSVCAECTKIYNKQYRELNAESVSIVDKAWRTQNAAHHRKLQAEWRASNIEHLRDYREAHRDEIRANYISWRERNLSHVKHYEREYYTTHKDEILSRYRTDRRTNPGKYAAWRMMRYTRVRHATPNWADMSLIRAVYEHCAQLTADTGIEYQVDHIYPINGETVCGLHVHTNLQILTAEQNRSKSNTIPLE